MQEETWLPATKKDIQTLRRGKFFKYSDGERANEETVGKEGRKLNTNNGTDRSDDEDSKDGRSEISWKQAEDKRRSKENEYSDDEGSKEARKNKFEKSVDDTHQEFDGCRQSLALNSQMSTSDLECCQHSI